jgi:hypothetical protein
MNKVLFAFTILALAIIACAGSSSPTTTEDYIKEYGGNAEVYDRIFALTDCSALQKEFDTANANAQRDAGTPNFKQDEGYMKAVDTRMKDIGCYK